MKAYEVDRHIMPGIPKPALKLKVERKDKALRRYQPLIDAEELDRQSYSAYHHLLTLTFLQLLRFRLTTLLKRKKER